MYSENVRTDDEIRMILRNRSDTVYHPVGTARMGTDEAAVVDPQLRVVGIQGLRVVDAFIMPTLIGGNTNAPSIMIGEKAADIKLAKKDNSSTASKIRGIDAGIRLMEQRPL